mmetsp:Transcript_18580/g.38073  ORF Transcript_18580/g.38073 Transcript_18580/m.38073 type:complete len:101 (-) Transcript_18580:1763-2065(-)
MRLDDFRGKNGTCLGTPVFENRKQPARACVHEERGVMDPWAPPDGKAVHRFSHRLGMQDFLYIIDLDLITRYLENTPHQSNPPYYGICHSYRFDGLFDQR